MDRMGCVLRGKRIASDLIFIFFPGALGILMFMSCAAGKETPQEENAPFELIWAQAQPWVSGTVDGPSGLRLSFELSPPRIPVRFKSLCYMQQTADLMSRQNRPDEFSASYTSLTNKVPVETPGCTVPALWQNELNQPDKAILVYEQDGLEHYFVIQDIVHKPLLAYPGKQ